jgi:hypothetical protein
MIVIETIPDMTYLRQNLNVSSLSLDGRGSR